MKIAMVTPLLALGTSGCTFGIGSTYVGQWATHRELDHTICIEDVTTHACARRVEVTHEELARAFDGVALIIPSFGLSHAYDRGVGTFVGARLESGLEYRTGYGVWAVGLRGSALVDSGKSDAVMAMASVLGHVSVARRLSLHAGVGYAPYAQFETERASRTSSSIGRGLVGAEALLMRRGEVHFSWINELDTVTELSPGAAYRSTGLTTSLGIDF